MSSWGPPVKEGRAWGWELLAVLKHHLAPVQPWLVGRRAGEGLRTDVGPRGGAGGSKWKESRGRILQGEAGVSKSPPYLTCLYLQGRKLAAHWPSEDCDTSTVPAASPRTQAAPTCCHLSLTTLLPATLAMLLFNFQPWQITD